MDFSTKLRMMRAKKGWSQEKLAQYAGIAACYISTMEKGILLPNSEWEQRLRKALDWGEQEEALLELMEGGEPCGEQETEPREAIGTL